MSIVKMPERTEQVSAYAVVCAQVVDLLSPGGCPDVLTNELDDVERVCEPRPVARKPSVKLQVSF